MDHDNLNKTSTGVVENEANAITRTKTMAEIISKSSDHLIPQRDPSVPCLRSSIQNKKADAVVSVLRRTRTMNEIIESNTAIMHEWHYDSNHFLRSSKNKDHNESPPPEVLSPPTKKVRIDTDDADNSSSQAQQLTRTKTMNEIISNNNLDMYQYLNETDHFLRSLKSKDSSSVSALSSECSESESTATINRTTENIKVQTNLEDRSPSPMPRRKIVPGSVISPAMKTEELKRLDKEYIDMQVQFYETRRKEIRCIIEMLLKSRMAHEKISQSAEDSLADIRALGDESSPEARKLELFLQFNREAVNRCPSLISEVMEMDKSHRNQIDNVESLFFKPQSLAGEGDVSEPIGLLSNENEDKIN